MTLEKAIETNGLIKQEDIPIGELDKLTALNLGIEALKRELWRREHDPELVYGPLQGETEG